MLVVKHPKQRRNKRRAMASVLNLILVSQIFEYTINTLNMAGVVKCTLQWRSTESICSWLVLFVEYG